MLEINVTGHITAYKECKTDLEALVFLQDIKDQHDAVLRPIVPPKPSLYYYSTVKHQESMEYRLAVREISKKFPLKVDIRTVDGGEDLI